MASHFKLIAKSVIWLMVGILPTFLLLVSVACFGAFCSVFTVINRCFAAIFRKDLRKLTVPIANFFCVEDMETQPTINIVVCITATGKIDVETLRESMKEKVLKMLSPKGTREFQQLEEYPVHYGGLAYWKKEEAFKIEDHVRYYDYEEKNTADQSFTDADVARLFTKMQTKPWPRGTSPWEMLVVNNYKTARDFGSSEKYSELSLLFLRIHHSMGDGYSILKFLVSNFEGSENLIAYPSFPPLKGLKRLLFRCALPFKFAAGFGKMIATRMPKDDCAWNPDEPVGSYSFSTVIAEGVDVDRIKFVKRAFGCSFQAVLNGLLAGVFRRMMIDAGQQVPEHIMSFIPMPLPKHPGGLTFHVTAGLLRMYVGEPDARIRLVRAAKEFSKVTQSVVPSYLLPMVQVFDRAPKPLLDKLSYASGVSVAISHMPGPAVSGVMGKHESIGTYFSIGTWRGRTGATITSLSTRGKIVFVFNLRTAVYPGTLESNTEKINAFISAELNELTKIASEEFSIEKVRGEEITLV